MAYPGFIEGWTNPLNGSADEKQAHAAALATFVPLPAYGNAADVERPKKVVLNSIWNHPEVVKALGFKFPRVHQITGSCFPAGTPVRMADGSEKPIESVHVGDRVVTHAGRSMPVNHVMARSYSGEMVTLHVQGFPFPLEMTADHQVAISQGVDGIDWVRAEDVEEGDKVLLGWNRTREGATSIDVADLLGNQAVILDELMKDHAYSKGNEPDVPNANITVARNIVRSSGFDWKGRVKLIHTRTKNAVLRHIPVCPSLGRLIGLYLAEGGCHEGRVTFTFSSKEYHYAAEVLALVAGLFGVEGEIEPNEARPTTMKVRFANKTLAAVLKTLMPGDVYTKRIPSVLFSADEETRRAVLVGWMDGDGHVGITRVKEDVRMTGVTCSPDLARDMTTLAFSCGLRAATRIRKARGISRKSYSVDLTGQRAMRLFPEVAHRADSKFLTNHDPAETEHGYARRVTKITSRIVECLPVFDFEVDEDHSFIAQGLTVHNCVWAGAMNAFFTRAALDAVVLKQPEKIGVPFGLNNYGRSRKRAGMVFPGSGSFGSTMAASLVEDGVTFADSLPGLPQWTNSDGIVYGGPTELKWSITAPIPAELDSLAKQHLITGVAELKSVQQLIDAIQIAKCPVTFACGRYINSADLKGSGTDAVVIGDFDSRGGHQTSVQGYWEHPKFGPLLKYQNNWPASVYPTDPDTETGTPCAVWVSADSFARIIDGGDAEAYALGGYQGFEAQTFSW